MAFAAGTSALSRGDWAAARQALGQAVAEAPQWADAYYNLAVAHAQLNDWPEATKALRRATALDPGQGDAWALLGAALWTAGELSDAYEALERAAALPGASASTLFNIAGLTLELGEYGTSAEWFAALGERGFQELPAQVQGEAHLRAAVAFYRAGALARSLAHLESAQKLNVRSPWLEVYLGHVLWASGAAEQAIDHYRRALVAGVHDREALTNLADGLLVQGGLSEAEMVLKNLLASDATDGGSWLRLGLCLLRQSAAGGSAEAREALSHALKQRLDDDVVRQVFSRAAGAETDVEVVVELFRTLVQEHPDDPEAHYYLGLALAQSGQNPGARDTSGAEGHLRAAGELAAGDTRYRAALANLLVGVGRLAEALSLAEALVREVPRSARYQALLAEVSFRAGRSEEALRAIDRALLLEPENRAYGEKRVLYLGGSAEPKRPAASAAPTGVPVTPGTSEATPTPAKAPGPPVGAQ
jgi:tetratricopeptide (TPR) repeat protein